MNMHNMPSGTIIGVARGPFEHFGILAESKFDGYRMVISGSFQHGKVVEEPLEEFAGGEAIRIVGYPGALPDWRVLQRARSVLDSEYLLLSWNCEHVVRFAHGLTPMSPQIWRNLAIVCSVLLVVAASRR